MVSLVDAFTVEDFDQFIQLPENADKIFEFIRGELFEVPSNPYSSKISQTIAGEIYIYLKGKDLGHLTGEAGGYRVFAERYAPDVAFLAKGKPLAQSGYNLVAPDLAVEVDFPSTTESLTNLRTKIANYLAAGTVLSLVLPETKTVEVYVPGEPVKPLGIDDTLDGGAVLPGFKLAVKEIFPPEDQPED
jgi:Uma2 family endonuclease